MNSFSKVSVESADERGISPLLAAVNSGNTPRVRELLEAGAQPDALKVSRSPLVSAIHHIENGRFVCSIDIVRMLLEHGADPNRPIQ